MKRAFLYVIGSMGTVAIGGTAGLLFPYAIKSVLKDTMEGFGGRTRESL